jgi:hypothetical protein
MQDRLMHDDAALDREIREALASEPSPDFLARVRRRLAAAPAPSRAPWWWPGAAAAAAVVAAIVWFVPQHAPLAGRAVPAIAVPSVAPAARFAEVRRPDPAATRLAEPQRPSRLASPEIIIDQREARAIVAFLDAATAGRVVVMGLPEPEPVASPELKRNLYIAPIVIESLSTTDRAEGVPK